MFSELGFTQQILLIIILILNLWSFSLFYIDKQRAIQKSKNRISEKTLLISAFVLGGIGALLGMSMVRHKTQHPNFKMLVPIAALITLGAIILSSGGLQGIGRLF